VLRLEVREMYIEWKLTLQVMRLGVPNSVMQVLMSMVGTLYNNLLRVYGDAVMVNGGDMAISAMTIANTASMFVMQVAFGINQGVGPIIGYNYGAKLYSRVRETVIKAATMALACTAFGWVIMMIFPQVLVGLFGGDSPELTELAIYVMRAAKLSFLFVGIQPIATQYFSSTARPNKSLILSITRQGAFLVPCLLLFSQLFGLYGIYYASAVSDFLSAALAFSMLAWDLRHLPEDGMEVANKLAA